MGDEIEGQWLDINDPDAGVRITFNDGDECTNGNSRTTIFNLFCSRGRTELTMAGEDGFSSCEYTFNFNTPVVCPGATSGSGGSTSSPSISAYTPDDGISYGTYFLIGLVCFTILYCVGGIYYKRKHSEEELSIKEAIPHVEFWKSLPSMVADGCRFTVNKVKSLISRTSNPSESEL